ncbi:MAG: FeoB-associated Cys-rich membrane protein [Clostridia bacterium]|nr:FeoB-associated Cys-rich membrane protein [Clostridia bacterium]
MENAIIIIVVALILALAIGYIIKAKKSGAKCIGCPSSKECLGCSCGCGETTETECD